MLKHGKYIYVDLGNKYLKVRVLKSRDENSPDRYVLTSFITKYKPRNAEIVKLDNLPIEVRDKITNYFL